VTDLALLDSEGWKELDDFQEALDARQVDADALWEACADRDWPAAVALLRQAGWTVEDRASVALLHVPAPERAKSEGWRCFVNAAGVDPELADEPG
jgi:hypothetical protein